MRLVSQNLCSLARPGGLIVIELILRSAVVLSGAPQQSVLFCAKPKDLRIVLSLTVERIRRRFRSHFQTLSPSAVPSPPVCLWGFKGFPLTAMSCDEAVSAITRFSDHGDPGAAVDHGDSPESTSPLKSSNALCSSHSLLP